MLNDRIKALRESTGMSAKSFAIDALKMKYTTYYGYENGSREPGSDFLIQFAEYFDVTIDYLLGRADDPHSLYSGQKKPASAKTETDDQLVHLCENYDALNSEGRERLVGYSDDLVAGGRYIKDNEPEILEEQA